MVYLGHFSFESHDSTLNRNVPQLAWILQLHGRS